MRKTLHLSAFALILSLAVPTVWADDWPQWLGSQRDSIWREQGVLQKLPKDGPAVKWRAKVAWGYSGPAVQGGRVYVFDFDTAGDPNTDSGNARTELEGKERLHCLDAASGKPLWKYEYNCTYKLSYPAGPRCTPTVSGGKVYALGAMGDLTCLDAVSGKKIWSRNLPSEYKATVPQWGYSGHPLVDGNHLITLAGGEGSVVVALDKETGKEIWRALSAKEIGYSPPTMIDAGGKRQLLIWHSEALNSLDPATGKLYWSEPLEPNFGMAIMAPRKLGNLVFTAGTSSQGMVVKLAADKPAAELLWRGKGTNGVYPVNSAPFLENGHIYGVDGDGNLRCVKLEDGQRLWSTSVPVSGEKANQLGTAFLVKHNDRFFIFNDLGQLVIAKMSPAGYEEISRAQIMEPTGKAFGRDVLWSHPAFANRCMFARNDRELVCVSLEDGAK
jgi:outer membrane protein assembly factor BamB